MGREIVFWSYMLLECGLYMFMHLKMSFIAHTVFEDYGEDKESC